MEAEKLAIHGGDPVIKKPFKRYNSIGREEIIAVNDVLEEGVLSDFLGVWGDKFDGGEQVQQFEREWSDYFQVKHSISVNSLTSGLFSMIGAIGISPGDEVIVTPWTMTATATAIVNWGGIPIFADIEPDYFCLNPDSVRKNITKKTKAVLTVDIFGQSSNYKELKKICDQYNLKLLSDTAQAPGATSDDGVVGTKSDIGGFSLNYHKHIHTGEGGMLVTNDDELALKLKLIRNHGEACVENSSLSNYVNIVGGNYRMGEIEAAIGRNQLKKLELLISKRTKSALSLIHNLKDLNGLGIPRVRENCSHIFYSIPLLLDKEKTGVNRAEIFSALTAEGVPGLAEGYINLHLLPMYQNKIALGDKGFPWTYIDSRKDIDYSKGICPVAEDYQDNKLLNLLSCLFVLDDEEISLITKAFQKVWKNLERLS